jgi:hypothetical protein
LKGHFAKSPLAELLRAADRDHRSRDCSRTLSAIGCVVIFFTRDSTIAFYGAVISAVAIIALFFGQRLAKVTPAQQSWYPIFR